MAKNPEQQERLSRFVQLAQDYRGWSRNQLAKALGRDATKIVPESGNPKLDLVRRLADVLEWSVGDVAELLTEPAPVEDGADLSEMSFADAFERGQEARANGDDTLASRLASVAYARATSAEERVRAVNLEAVCWDRLGRYQSAMDALRNGLSLSGVSASRRRMLQVNLANAHYSLWNLEEAGAIAQSVISAYQANPSTLDGLRDRANLAFARYVLGHTYRRAALIDPSRGHEALASLQDAIARYERLCHEASPEYCRAVSFACEGGVLECLVGLGEVSAEDAVARVQEELTRYTSLDDCESPGMIESVGWWAVFGANIAFQLQDPTAIHRGLAIFTNKIYDVAETLDNWALRERAFSLENLHHETTRDLTGITADRIIDSKDVKVIAGTMGRFPRFRSTGWAILNASRVVRGD